MDRFDWLELDKVAPAAENARHAPPCDGPSFYRAARRMRESGHFGAAAALYQKATGFDEHFYAAWVEWIDTLIRAGHLADAERRSAEALDAYRRVRVFYAARALVLAHQGRLSEAEEHAEIALAESPMWYAHLVRAEIFLLHDAQNLRGPALNALAAALRCADAPWEPHFIGGLMLLDAGWPAQAAAYFSEAVHARPAAVAGLLCLGDCFQALRLYDQALFYYHKAIEVEPANELARAREAQCAPLLYGLTRIFRREDLRAAWNREYNRWKETRESNIVDF